MTRVKVTFYAEICSESMFDTISVFGHNIAGGVCILLWSTFWSTVLFGGLKATQSQKMFFLLRLKNIWHII